MLKSMSDYMWHLFSSLVTTYLLENLYFKMDFVKLFGTSNIVIVKSCQEFFGFELPSTLLSKRIAKFESVHYNPLLMMNSVALLPCRKLI